MFLLEQRGNTNIAQKVWEQSKRQTNSSLQQLEKELHEHRPGVSNSKCQWGFRYFAKHNKQKTGCPGWERRRAQKKTCIDYRKWVILETSSSIEKTRWTTVDIKLPGVNEIKTTWCYCPENVNTPLLINSCSAIQLTHTNTAYPLES